MLPVFPDNVNVVLFVPVHTVALPAMVPPTDAGSTVITADPLKPIDKQLFASKTDVIEYVVVLAGDTEILFPEE